MAGGGDRMHARARGAIGLVLLVMASQGGAQETAWQPAGAARPTEVRLGRPTPLEAAPTGIQQVSLSTSEPRARAQAPDPLIGGAPPPPPPFPGAGVAPAPPGGPSP